MFFLDKQLLVKSLSNRKAIIKGQFKFKYNYNKMDKDLQTKFEQTMNHYINITPTLANLSDFFICLIKKLNTIQTLIRNCIIKAAKKIILNHKVVNNNT